jgi:hypothetical protein
MKVRALDDALHGRIKALCGEGDELAAAGAFEAALEKYGEAWMLLSDPKEEWGASTWILGAIADASFLGGHNEWALNALEHTWCVVPKVPTPRHP